MARLGIVFGLVLCGLTVAGLVVSPVKSPSQFVPMMLGIPVLFCGVVALNPHRCRRAMQVALALAALGAVVASGQAVTSAVHWAGGEEPNRVGFAMVVSMALVCLLFFIAGAVLYSLRQKNGSASAGRQRPSSGGAGEVSRGSPPGA